METKELLAKLAEINFFEKFKAESEQKYVEFVTEKHDESTQGDNAPYFKRYPGLSLVPISMDLRINWLETDVENLAENSFGMFEAYEIQIVGEEDYPTFEFTIDTKVYTTSGDAKGFPNQAIDFVFDRFAKINDGVKPHEIVHPTSEKSRPIVFCTPDAFKRLQDADLVPADRESVKSQGLPEWVD